MACCSSASDKTAAYGRNSYLVEFDPKTEKMRIVLDAHKLVGLPAEPTGYAAQSKIHTRNFVGPSGVIYAGTKQGYPTAEEKKSGKIATYRGGYVITYDPVAGKAANLGMPMPRLPSACPPRVTSRVGGSAFTAGIVLKLRQRFEIRIGLGR